MNPGTVPERSRALRFVVLMGFVSLFADAMTYEGARSLTGPFLQTLGAIGTFTVGAGRRVGRTARMVTCGWSRAGWPRQGRSACAIGCGLHRRLCRQGPSRSCPGDGGHLARRRRAADSRTLRQGRERTRKGHLPVVRARPGRFGVDLRPARSHGSGGSRSRSGAGGRRAVLSRRQLPVGVRHPPRSRGGDASAGRGFALRVPRSWQSRRQKDGHRHRGTPGAVLVVCRRYGPRGIRVRRLSLGSLPFFKRRA